MADIRKTVGDLTDRGAFDGTEQMEVFPTSLGVSRKKKVGTAAERDVTASATDTTANRVTKVGDGGVLGAAPTFTDANLCPLGTFMRRELPESDTAAANLPQLGGVSTSSRAWTVKTFGTNSRVCQEATEVFGIGTTKGRTFYRVNHDTWQPWREIPANGIIGTVRYSAGSEPDGPLFEKGTGFTKFADGTMIQYASYNDGRTASGPHDTIVNLPIGFASTNYRVSVNSQSGQPENFSPGHVISRTTSAVTIRANRSNDIPAIWDLIAIGRWRE